MKLFVWQGDGVLQNWTSGIMIALAHDVDEARTLIRERHAMTAGYMADNEQWLIWGLWLEPTVHSIDEPIAFLEHGGS